MRALITGGRGFAGRWLAQHLEAQGDVVAITDRETDVADDAAITAVVRAAAPDAVYHLAAMTHVGESWDVPGEVLRVNVLGTAAVLAAARSLDPVPTTLVVSSAEVYGTVTPDELPLTEDHPSSPVSPYAASKAAAEAVARQAWRGYDQPVVIVRPFNHIGPGQPDSFVVSALARRIVEARRRGSGSLRVGTLAARRDYSDVRDVVRAYRLLVEVGESGGVYNVCTGRDVSVAEVAARLLELSGVELELETDPELVRAVDVPVLRGDPTRLTAATGWRPELPLDETLRDVLADWEHQLAGTAPSGR